MMLIHLDPDQVPVHLRGNYTGRKFKALIGETVTIPADAGLWEGGSRETFRLVRLSDGATVSAVEHNLAPWDAGRRAVPVTLRSGFAVIRHSMFCGKDMGLTFYILASDAAPMLPAPAPELSTVALCVLSATARFKASYGGRDRYEMARGDYGAPDPFPTREQWNTAKVELIGRGLLNKAGAITTAGRNAMGNR